VNRAMTAGKILIGQWSFACILQIVGSLPNCALSPGLVKELVPDAMEDRKARHGGGSRTS